ncbi:hypothetical protein HMPREF1552_00214 [Leptotrichia sp. oral taxon 879 str. F0557]|nr:hypothetical protein HMPREF1552_00214 [Leptotrichia sp. oral taxon 879 str. F0557]
MKESMKKFGIHKLKIIILEKKMRKWGLKRSKREMWQELDERPAILERKFCENSKKLL